MIGAMNTIPAAILIIENHPMMRAALCAAIADEPGLTIAVVAANGADVMQMVTALHPLTSNEVAGQEQAALDAGAQAVLTKAAPRAELLRVLRELHTKAIMDQLEVNVVEEVAGKIY